MTLIQSLRSILSHFTKTRNVAVNPAEKQNARDYIVKTFKDHGLNKWTEEFQSNNPQVILKPLPSLLCHGPLSAWICWRIDKPRWLATNICDNVRFVKTWSTEPDLKGSIETTSIRERARWSESCFLIGYPSASCPLGVPALVLQVKVLFLGARNKSFIDQACSVKMGEYWPPSILRFYWPWEIKTQRRTWQ